MKVTLLIPEKILYEVSLMLLRAVIVKLLDTLSGFKKIDSVYNSLTKSFFFIIFLMTFNSYRTYTLQWLTCVVIICSACYSARKLKC